MSATATIRWVEPWDAAYSYAGRVGKTLVTPYSVHGRLPERTVEDMIRSLKKHVAEVLDLRGAEFLTGYDANGEPAISDAWEVRLWDEAGAMRFPFARVSLVGPDTSTGPTPGTEQVRQPVTIHLYPFPALDSERAWLQAWRLSQLMADALLWGAARGKRLAVPIWDHHGLDLYQDSEYRHPSDFVRVEGLSTDRMLDPEDDRYTVAIVSFTAQWRRAPNAAPGYLVESVRITAHPE